MSALQVTVDEQAVANENKAKDEAKELEEEYEEYFPEEGYTPLFPERRFWFLSVNPVYDALAAAGGFSAQNRLIDDFNVRLEEEFPEGYLDSCSYLREYGYNAPDGVHYDGATYYAIQDYCRREIMRRLEE